MEESNRKTAASKPGGCRIPAPQPPRKRGVTLCACRDGPSSPSPHREECGDGVGRRQTSLKVQTPIFKFWGLSPALIGCHLLVNAGAGLGVCDLGRGMGGDLFPSHNPSSTGNGGTAGFLPRPLGPEGWLWRRALSHPRRLPSGNRGADGKENIPPVAGLASCSVGGVGSEAWPGHGGVLLCGRARNICG